MMKRRIFLSIVLTSLMVLPFQTQTLFAEGETSSGFPQIVYVEGAVTVNISGGEWVSAEKGTALLENSAVKTEDQSYCDIALDKELKNIISIGPNSEVKLGKDFNQIDIAKGRVFSELKALPPGSMFEVVTPQAIAGVRGTAWESVIGATAQFNVKDSTIYVKGKDAAGKITGKEDVPFGNSIVVDPSGWLGELKELNKEDADRMEAWSSRIASAIGSASSKGCGDLIDGFTGAAASLFGQVMECEAGGQEESFAAAGSEIASVQGETEQGLPGSDITQSTFVQTPLTEESPEEPPSNPPPVPKISSCPAGPHCND